ncbi:MAG: tripartite tricarboxylate transporter substrate binding protein [Alphaproteobacteria bacterium]|jgi:tripartite-type tricarboxylate transporter receptor subunit TctC|nr:tripartite tricarboxylate transporter substrate binding protein [Alphaproteobacteria bacterium]
MRIFSKLIGGALLAATLSSGVLAAGYPDKPITLICPYSAGGGGDTASRMIAKLAGDMMGVQINVENKTGGGATIGISAVANAKPDGYTIGFISTSPITIRPHMMDAPYNPIEDLTYIGQFVASSQPLIVRADSSYKTLDDVIAYARENPGKLRWSTSVQRGGPHVAVEAMFKSEGVDATFVPFKGGSKVLAALLGGTIEMAMISEGNKATLDGQTRILAEGTPNKNPVAPDAPVLTEKGYPIAPAIFFGLAAPKGLPAEVIAKWDEVLPKVIASPEFQQLAEARKWTVDHADHAAFTKIVESDYAAAKKAIADIGMK